MNNGMKRSVEAPTLKSVPDLQKTEIETRRHIDEVRKILHRICRLLIRRGEGHDASKLEEPELSGFAEVTQELYGVTYASEEYAELLTRLGKTLEHHYAKNRHHPEHYPDGVEGMTLIDLVEMFCDWKAATMKHADGNILQSIDANVTRFGLTKQLAQILRNTAAVLDK